MNVKRGDMLILNAIGIRRGVNPAKWGVCIVLKDEDERPAGARPRCDVAFGSRLDRLDQTATVLDAEGNAKNIYLVYFDVV
jgi:hypothetical protein